MSKKTSLDLSDILKDSIRKFKSDQATDGKKALNILEYAETLLGERLSFAQKIICKLFYAGSRFNEDLRVTEEEIEVMQKWDIEQTWLFEGETSKLDLYRKFVNEELREKKLEIRREMLRKLDLGLDISEEQEKQDGEDPLWFNELILVLGRRSGKSYLTALLCSYEAYKLIMLGDPKKFYGINSDIAILNTAVKEDQAEKIIFREIKKFIRKCPVFDGRIGKFGAKEIRILTDVDLEYNNKLQVGEKPEEGSILILCGSSSSGGLRGHTPICIIYDELAHFVNSDGKSSAKEVYNALSRSSATFKMWGDGRQIVLSSPYDTSGFFYDLYNKSKTVRSMLMFQIPTWNANPRVPKSELQHEFEMDPEYASVEYGAQFKKKKSLTYFPHDKIEQAMYQRPDWVMHQNGTPGYEYYLHIDAADTSDRYAFMVIHVERRYDPEIREIVEYWVEDYSYFMCMKKNKGVAIDPDHIVDTYILPLFKNFNIMCVSFDGVLSREQRKKIAMKCPLMKEIRFAGRQKNNIYDNTRNKMMSGRIELCMDDVELAGELRCVKIDHGKTPPKIDKDAESKFPYDDLVDCLCGAIYAANKGSDGETRLPRIGITRTGRR